METKTAIKYTPKSLTPDDLIRLYSNMLRPRMVEEKMLKLLRQGKISKWFSGIGQEAIAVGAVMAMKDNEVVFPMHRNLGVFTTRKIPLYRLFSQWQGKMGGFTKGRDRSFHFGTSEFNIVGMISHLGPQLSLACGVALAHKVRNEQKITITFTGEGGTSQGEFHEALNVASVWKLPVIFIVENNGYGLSTPTSEQFVCKSLADRGKGYGMKSKTIDGNNIIEVYQTINKISNDIRKKPEPFLLECMTFRRRGHEEASGTKYVPKDVMEFWETKDPISNFEDYLFAQGILNAHQVSEMRASIKTEIEQDWNKAFSEEMITSSPEAETADLFVPYDLKLTLPQSGNLRKMRFVDAISNAIDLAMEQHPELILMGQDIAEYGGVFKVTQGLFEKYGEKRVRNTPLCESAILGAAVGLSIEGMKSMVEMQFADFVTCGFNQIINNMAKLHYRWGQNVDSVVRMPTGGGLGAGPFHSQCNEAWFTHTPGLKVVYPSNPYDAKGLLLASFEDPNPILFFEHKGLYRNISDEIPEDYYTIPLGVAKLTQEGSEVSIITYGMGVHWAVELVEEINISADILDLRTLVPLDYKAIEATVKKTNKVLIIHEDVAFGGIGGEIASYISEFLFEHLDGPVVKIGSLDTPIPFAVNLEEMFLPKERFTIKLKELLAY